MTFRNSVVAGEDLVRTGIRSPDYVPGVSGWRIARDGSAEFNNVTVRGSLVTGPAGSAHIEIPAGLALIEMFTGDVDETFHGIVFTDIEGAGGGRTAIIGMVSPQLSGGDAASVVVRSESEDGTTSPSRVELNATELEIDGGPVQTITDTTDASGYITFAHGAAQVPQLCLVTVESPIATPVVWCSGVDSYGATTARARFSQHTGGAIGTYNSSSATFRVLTIV